MTSITDQNKAIYEALKAPFDITFTDNRGGVSLTYITGEQVVTRLNDVLGVAGWSFTILRNDINAEADEAWALGELAADVSSVRILKQQFGSQKIKRSRATGAPLDIGFDLKGAATDALKKCASLLGVGLYLSKKEGGQSRSAPRPPAARPAAVAAPQRTSNSPANALGPCATCGATNLAGGGRIDGKTYCGDDYRKLKSK